MPPGLPDEHVVDEIRESLRISVLLGEFPGRLIVRY